jgi:endonuclease/exonuclease/phosphatase family metal-dependent hydrolase
MVVATWNLWGFGEPWRYTERRGESRGAVPGSPAATLRLPERGWPRRRSLLIQALARVQPAIIGLQEVCPDPSTGASQAEPLAAELGYAQLCRSMATTDPGGGQSAGGLAVLSRYPVSEFVEVPLPCPEDTEQYAVRAVLSPPGRAMDLFVVHLTPRSEAARLEAVKRIVEEIGERKSERTTLVMGDFNCLPGSPPLQALTSGAGPQELLRDAWREVHADTDGPTMPSQAPVVRLDYILVAPEVVVRRIERIGQEPDVDGFYASDHLGVVATLSDNLR